MKASQRVKAKCVVLSRPHGTHRVSLPPLDHSLALAYCSSLHLDVCLGAALKPVFVHAKTMTTAYLDLTVFNTAHTPFTLILLWHEHLELRILAIPSQPTHVDS